MAANDSPLATVLDTLTVPGELYEKRPDGAVTCYACGHRCLIKPGRRGICQVRFNQEGELRVPWGYVGALQCDPTETKPFFHVYPGSDTLTFGMLGCDLHCPYCFAPETAIVTDQGIQSIGDLFELGTRRLSTPEGEVSQPNGMRAMTASGQWRRVEQVFKHQYSGDLTVIRAVNLPTLRCTPDHSVYVTLDPTVPVEKMPAGELTAKHFLAVPRGVGSIIPETVEMAGVAEPYPLGSGGHPGHQRMGLLRWVSSWYTTADFFLVPICEVVKASYDGHVYNMEVEGEHNYLANFALVANCQNWVTSQALRDPASEVAGARPQVVTPQQLVALARQQGAQLVGSSYNEPLITSEWAAAVFKEAVAAGLKCVYISNGNATREVLEYIRPYVSGYKIDLKTMSDRSYRKLGAVLQNVLDGIQMVHQMGFWLEIVTLVIPGFNDSTEELMDAARFLAALSPDIPWHVTAFHQDYKMTAPDNATVGHLIRAAEIGQEAGLRYVYAGNLPGQVGDYEHTFCHQCRQRLITRFGYRILDYALTAQGACPRCGTLVPGVWTDRPDRVRRHGPGAPRAVRGGLNRSSLAR
jgi:pyruvate formate lyase activating enzyme